MSGRRTLPRRPADRSGHRSLLGLAIGAHLAERALALVLLVAGARLASESAYHALTRWDAKWYAHIAQHGYGNLRVAADGRRLVDYAFFPLYPALERVVAEISGLSPVNAGLLISLVSSVVAAAGIYRVGAALLDARAAVVLVCLWSSIPVADVTSMAYTESLFTAFAAWSLAAVLSERLVAAGVLAALAGLTRPLGVAVVVAVLVAAVVRTADLRAGPRPADDDVPETRAGRRPWTGWTSSPTLAAVIAPLGLLGYLGFVRWHSDGHLSYSEATRSWGNHVDGGRAFARWVWELVLTRPAVGILLVAGLVALAAAVWHTRRYPWPVLAFTVTAVVVSLSTSAYFGSRPRYLLPVFTLLLWPSTLLVRLRLPQLVIVLAVLAVASGVYGAIWLLGSGPP